MKLILLSEVTDLGKKGDLVDVSDGYARNYLLPKRKAMKATEGALQHAETLRAVREEADRAAKDEATRIASQLAGIRVVLAAQAGDEGKLYGSVGTADVVAGITKFTGVTLDRQHIELRSPIKAIGLHEVWVKLHPEVEFPVTLDVIPA
ncbi:MAG TPA: 50S ribosomal protein L9 [Acidimicrobiia bacterium]|nr:50S ribosomal protein L9 [Acidimicrobiia bacterium]